jgi:hypothetical protein
MSEGSVQPLRSELALPALSPPKGAESKGASALKAFPFPVLVFPELGVHIMSAQTFKGLSETILSCRNPSSTHSPCNLCDLYASVVKIVFRFFLSL